MTVRLKFAKYGTLKFISHLDIMRYFQKANRRAGIKVKYSEGFHPHQVMSFAAPLSVGETSEGEYFDMDIEDGEDHTTIKERLNVVNTEGMRIIEVVPLPDPLPQTKRPSVMALVAASDYLVMLKDGYENIWGSNDLFIEKFTAFLSQPSILAVKKSKSGEEELDVKPFIFKYSSDISCTDFSDEYENGLKFYLMLSAGSVNHIKPQVLIKAFCEYSGKEYNEYAWQIHRFETYSLVGDEYRPIYEYYK